MGCRGLSRQLPVMPVNCKKKKKREEKNFSGPSPLASRVGAWGGGGVYRGRVGCVEGDSSAVTECGASSSLIVIPCLQAHCRRTSHTPWERFPRNLRKKDSFPRHGLRNISFSSSRASLARSLSRSHAHRLPLTLALCPRVSLFSHSSFGHFFLSVFFFSSPLAQLPWASLHPSAPLHPHASYRSSASPSHAAGVGSHSDK